MAGEEPTVALIAAVAANGVIGRDGEMPWHYPADVRHFRETTTGHPVIVGRRTYENVVEGLGEPLPGRTSVVLTSRDRDLPEGAVAVGSVEAALAVAREDLARRRAGGGQRGPEPIVYVAGGATVYEQFLPLADRLVLTEIHEAHEGDACFPAVDWEEWVERDREDRAEFSLVTYERRSGGGE